MSTDFPNNAEAFFNLTHLLHTLQQGNLGVDAVRWQQAPLALDVMRNAPHLLVNVVMAMEENEGVCLDNASLGVLLTGRLFQGEHDVVPVPQAPLAVQGETRVLYCLSHLVEFFPPASRM
jgi:hypothetical protein